MLEASAGGSRREALGRGRPALAGRAGTGAAQTRQIAHPGVRERGINHLAAVVPVPAAGRAGRRGGRGLGRLLLDLEACGRDDVPLAAERVDVLSRGLTGLLVLQEGVERVAAVGDLQLPVAAAGRAEQRGLDAAPGRGLRAREQRRPEGRTLPVT